MSLTTHDPMEPCVGHCGACGAYADWSERIVKLLEALERIASHEVRPDRRQRNMVDRDEVDNLRRTARTAIKQAKGE